MNTEINRTFLGPPEIPYGEGNDMEFFCWSAEEKAWVVISAARFWGFFRHYPFWCYYKDGDPHPAAPSEEDQRSEEARWKEDDARSGITP